jgi:hypothetical protein
LNSPDALSILGSTKEIADQKARDSRRLDAFIKCAKAEGWSESDVAEYITLAKRIIERGNAQDLADARRFWAEKIGIGSAKGINQRMRESIERERKVAA